MSQRYLAMAEGWIDHPFLRRHNRAYSREAAWFWLIKEAKWRDQGDLKRGELEHSLRFIAKAWGWTLAKVRWFLDAACDAGLITKRSQHGTLTQVITICNYDKYQASSKANNTKATQQQHNNSTDSYQDQDHPSFKKKKGTRAGARDAAQTEILMPINGGGRRGKRRKSPVEKLYEGAARAADTWERRERDRGADCPADEPLLDRRRSAGDP